MKTYFRLEKLESVDLFDFAERCFGNKGVVGSVQIDGVDRNCLVVGGYEVNREFIYNYCNAAAPSAPPAQASVAHVSFLGLPDLGRVRAMFAGLDVIKVCRLSRGAPDAWLVGLADEPNAEVKDLWLSAYRQLDIGFDYMLHRSPLTDKRLVVMDMDSTLVQVEVVDELARLAGAHDKVALVTERAMRGELDFETSLRQRVACLKGLDYQKVVEFSARLPITQGAERLVNVMHARGAKLAVVSGGFMPGALSLQKQLGLDHAFANTLGVKDGKLSGEVIGEIVGAEKKAQILETLAQEYGLSLDQTVAMGDGANDIPMMKKSGLGVAFYGKPKVRHAADGTISQGGLDNLLYHFGLDDLDIASSIA